MGRTGAFGLIRRFTADSNERGGSLIQSSYLPKHLSMSLPS